MSEAYGGCIVAFYTNLNRASNADNGEPTTRSGPSKYSAHQIPSAVNIAMDTANIPCRRRDRRCCEVNIKSYELRTLRMSSRAEQMRVSLQAVERHPTR
jgi:hypothetical protein